MEPKARQVPTAARLLVNHAKWYAEVNRTARAITNHVSSTPTDDPVLAELIEHYQQLTKDKPVKEDPRGGDRPNQ